MTERFAVYLAKTLLSEGYEEGVPPAAAPLADDADYALVRSDGMTLELAVIIDREARPGARFTQSAETVLAALQRCLQFCGRMGFTQMPASLSVYEVGPAEPGQQARLKALNTGRRSTVFAGWAIDPDRQAVWCSRPQQMWFRGRRLARLLREPRLSDVALAAPAHSEAGRPFATYALLGLLGAIFVGEAVLAGRAASGLLNMPSGLLFLLGGTVGELVFAREQLWRMVTAAFLHGGLLHIGFNAFALLLVGSLLERLVGWAWFLAVFFAGAAGGSLMSALLNPLVLSVGASGAILALAGAALVVASRLDYAARQQVRTGLLQMLVPSLLPVVFLGRGTHVDYGAHIGGAIVGVLMGAVMLYAWPRTALRPGGSGAAALLSAAGAAVALLGGALVVQRLRMLGAL